MYRIRTRQPQYDPVVQRVVEELKDLHDFNIIEIIYSVLRHCSTPEEYRKTGRPLLEQWLPTAFNNGKVRKILRVMDEVYSEPEVNARLGHFLEWLIWRIVYLNRQIYFPGIAGSVRVERQVQFEDASGELLDPHSGGHSYDVVIARVHHQQGIVIGWGFEVKYSLGNHLRTDRFLRQLKYMDYVSSQVAGFSSWVLAAHALEKEEFSKYCREQGIARVNLKLIEELWV